MLSFPTLALALTLTLLTLTTAQLDVPTCADACFETAIAASGCGATDYFCQCTTGATALQNSAIGCLCKSTCSTTELLQIVQDTNGICSTALAASSMTYTAQTVGLGACATAGSSSVTATGTAASASATTKTGASSGAASSSASKTTASSAVASTSATLATASTASGAGSSVVAWEGAVVGLAGLAAWFV